MRLCKIKSIKRIGHRKRYDISVANHHNFFANGVLVHNCTSFYQTHFHARSMDSRMHLSRSLIAQLHATVRLDIPSGDRVCLENMYARHSIFYRSLPSYGLVFGYYDKNNVCQSWDDTVEYAQMLGLSTVKVLWRSVFNLDAIRACYTGVSAYEGYDKPRRWSLAEWNDWCLTGKLPVVYADSDFAPDEEPVLITEVPNPVQEGYVVRLARSFHYDDFASCVFKWVRKSHVSTSQHWLTEMIVPNGLAKV